MNLKSKLLAMPEVSAIRMLIAMLDRDLRWRVLGLAALGIVAAVLEVISAFGVVWLIGLLHDPANIEKLPLHGSWVAVLGTDTSRTLLLLSIFVAIFYALKNCFVLFQTYLLLSVPYNASLRVSSRLLSYYLTMPYALHLQRNSAELVRNVLTSVDVVFRTVMIAVVNVLSDLLICVGLVSLLLFASSRETIVAVATLALAAIAILRLSQNAVGRWGEEVQRRSKDLLQLVTQSLHGIKDVRILGSERYFIANYAREREALSNVLLYRETLGAAPRLILETLLIVCLVSLIVLVGVGQDSRRDLIPLLGLYAYAGFRLMPIFSRMAISLQNVRYGAAAVRDLFLDLSKDAAPPPASAPSASRIDLTEEIRAESLSFAYAGSAKPSLIDVDLAIRRGEKLGIAGATGSGKSTLVDIALGLLEPTEGRLLVDGRDIWPDPRPWQKSIGYVPQSPFLLDDTIRRNVAFGLRDEDIDDRAVDSALRLAQLDDFVRQQPNGLDTTVGERGVRISGGQRQRIAIARALYRKPSVLVFDEATSALDNTTERAISDAIMALGGERTLIIVAHRLTTLRDCDRIVFVDQGRIEAVGSYDQLIARAPAFSAMVAVGSL